MLESAQHLLWNVLAAVGLAVVLLAALRYLTGKVGR